MPKSRSRRTNARPAARRRSTTGSARRPPTGPPPTAAPGRRGAVERRSGPALVWLSRQPKVLVPALSLVLLVAGAALPARFGLPLLLLLLGLVGWLSYLSWPAVVGRARLVRVVTLALVTALAVTRALEL